jgi:hypothetical protein
VISLKNSSENSWLPLRQQPQVMFMSDNRRLIQVQYFDIRINPGWNFSGGNYHTGIQFIISAQ